MKSYTIDEYKKAGCSEMEFPAMIAVHGITRGQVCDTGCHAFGRCDAYQKLTSGLSIDNKVIKELSTESVRDEAKRRDISISQVRRERK
jgi:hypothetical protein